MIAAKNAQVESVTSRMAEKDHEHSSQLQEYAQLLDIKAARIKKLEGQLRDIAYGTRQVKVDTRRFEYLEEPEENVQLERGQNLLQFHVGQVSFLEHIHECRNNSKECYSCDYNYVGYSLK